MNHYWAVPVLLQRLQHAADGPLLHQHSLQINVICSPTHKVQGVGA